ncbi:DivIVA domain-containing protein [Candidatus Fermentibacteria bacterium]|nr:DivIVA domain-containing protein [Candidatus Fermentibacteria bacterium]
METLSELSLHSFRKSLRGYNPDEVDSYLELIDHRVHNLQKELDGLRRENESLKSELRKYQRVESALQETLVETKRNAEMMRKAAEKEAELVLEKAEQDARQRVMVVQMAVSKLSRETEDLERRRLDYIEKLRSLAERQLSILRFYEDVQGPVST